MRTEFDSINPNFPKVAESCRVSERQARNWGNTYGWTEAADRRDLAVACKSEVDAIACRAKMIEEQRKIGNSMHNVGAAYLQDKGRKTANGAKDALSLIKEGFALEKQSEGPPRWIMGILNADEQQLRDEYAEFLSRGDSV